MSRAVSVRYDLLRGHVKYGEAKGIGSAAVSMDRSRKIKTIFSGDLILPAEIDLFTDRLRPVLLRNGKEHPLGLFILTDTKVLWEKGSPFVQCEGYDLGYLVMRTRTEKRMFFAAGTRYTDVLQSLLQLCGIENLSMTASEKTLATHRSDWEMGTSVLDIINQLADELGYESLWFDCEGTAQLHPQKQAEAECIDFWYGPGRQDGYLLTGEEGCRQEDLFERYNVVTVVCENPDLPQIMTATAVNDDPESIFSVQRMGRAMAPLVKVQNIPDEASLAQYAQRLLWEQIVSQETVQIKTTLGPICGCGAIIALEGGPVSGIYRAEGWTMELSYDGWMEHTLKRGRYR